MAFRWHLPFLFLLVGCAAPDTTGIKLIGHGGLGPGGEHPMNSREAVLLALEQGLDGVELDVQMTADSVLVAHHDLELTGANSCQGAVNALTWAALDHCSPAFHGVRLDSLLAEAITLHPGAEFTFDVKLNTKDDWWTYLRLFSRAIHRLEQETGMQRRVLVECRTADFLHALGEEASHIPRYLYGDDAERTTTEALATGCSGITLHVDQVSAEDVARAQAQGLAVTVFGVSGTYSLRKAVALHPDRIQLDQ